MLTKKLDTGTEIWKDVKGYEGRYKVSNLGNVKSLDRIVFNKGSNLNGFIKGTILKAGTNGSGYLFVNFWFDGKIKNSRVHRLVATSFCDGYTEGLHVNHIDGIKTNNHFSNLEWCTSSHNILHALRTGLNPSRKGQNNGNSILNEKDILKMRRKYENGMSQIEICIHYPLVKRGTIKNILGKRTWKHLL